MYLPETCSLVKIIIVEVCCREPLLKSKCKHIKTTS